MGKGGTPSRQHSCREVWIVVLAGDRCGLVCHRDLHVLDLRVLDLRVLDLRLLVPFSLYVPVGWAFVVVVEPAVVELCLCIMIYRHRSVSECVLRSFLGRRTLGAMLYCEISLYGFVTYNSHL